MLSILLSACTSPAPAAPHNAAADRFLARYVTADGRVIRHDQGGDIVSEGQAYGMVIAELAGRPDVARTIWAWTKRHLRNGHGLLAYHATATGQVLDKESAADADVLTAYALLRYDGSGSAALHAAGRRLAAAVLAQETARTGGAPVVLAGPWARSTTPPTVNPSYWMPAVYRALAGYTGDHRWRDAADAAVRLIAQLTDGGHRLPTDWAKLTGTGVVAAGAPDGSTPAQYGLDAARLPLWFATSCTPAGRGLAARWWHILAKGQRAAALALSPAGALRNRATNPLPLLAGAAAAASAGDSAASAHLRHRAAMQAARTPTYYGDAWLVIGNALLDGSLDPCQEATGG